MSIGEHGERHVPTKAARVSASAGSPSSPEQPETAAPAPRESSNEPRKSEVERIGTSFGPEQGLGKFRRKVHIRNESIHSRDDA
jgi:hypothetical protein